jgi:hypothetical protein
MSKPRFNTAAVVLGMHRSGTSALAGILRLQGFASPRTVLPSSAVNERGFWESERINALNDELFAEMGTSWHGLNAISLRDLPVGSSRDADSRTEAILKDEFASDASPLIKDPRLCRLLPLWQPTLDKLARRTVYPIILRNPVEVARSLAERNDFDLELGYLLWARYYLDAEFHTRNSPRVLITYDELIRDWRSVKGLIAALDVDFEDDADDVAAGDYLSATLRHHRTADEQVSIEVQHLPLVQQTFGALLDWAHQAPGTDIDPDPFDRAREDLDRFGGPLSHVIENARLDRKRLNSARSRADSISAELGRVRRAEDELSGVRASLEKQSAAQAQLEKRLEWIATSLSNAIQERSRTDERLADAHAEAQQARLEAARAQRERAAFEQLLGQAKAETEAQRVSLNAALANSERARETLLSEIQRLESQARTAAQEHERERADLQARHDQRVVALSSERKELVGELKDVKRKYRSTQHQLARDREKLRRTQERLAQVEQNLAEIRGSAVWRTYGAIIAEVRRCESIAAGLFGGSNRKQRALNGRLIRNSPLFDADWYMARYADVAAAGIDPAVHYLETGWKEGRDPGQSFSTTSYLRLNPDVARANINPLLHFIKFGCSEGRHLSDLPATSKSAVAAVEEFGPANPCASFELGEEALVRWQRAARLAQAGRDLLTIGSVPIGLIKDQSEREVLRKAFARLRKLSGSAQVGDGPKAAAGRKSSVSRLADAWYVSRSQLRTRWIANSPLVVRAYQYEPEKALSMVGEGIVISSLDFVDISLSNPFFPVLFVLSEPDGTIGLFELLAFPSLCRGGLHYSELIASGGVAERSAVIDVSRISAELAGQLEMIVDGSALPHIKRIAVDLGGADGTEPIFHQDFQSWLSNVLRIGVEPLDGIASTYLASAVMVERDARHDGRILILAADMVPTVSALAMRSRHSDVPLNGAISLLVSADDPAQPAMLIELPSEATAMGKAGPDQLAAWPRLDHNVGEVAAEPVPALAIRHPKRPILAEAELLVPVAHPSLPLPERDPEISWLVFPQDWDEDQLNQGLQALSLQLGSRVVLVGEVKPATTSAAQLLFNGRLLTFGDLNGALDAIRTPFAGYLGPHVLLHDKRTSRILAEMMECSSVLSASCVLVSSEKRGKAWHVSVADPGLFSAIGGEERSLSERCVQAPLFWRSTYPALRPPRDLWIARTASVRGWLQRAGPLRPHEGIQLCTSLVTASYLGEWKDAEPHLRPPAAAELQSIRSEVLFG